MSFNQRLQEVLDQRQKQQLYRQRKTLQSTQGPEVLVDGHSFLNFSSNDYLGLAGHPEITAAFKTAANQFGVGSGASHLVCGHSSLHHQLEEALAEFTGRPRALLFSSGYMANIGSTYSIMEGLNLESTLAYFIGGDETGNKFKQLEDFSNLNLGISYSF